MTNDPDWTLCSTSFLLYGATYTNDSLVYNMTGLKTFSVSIRYFKYKWFTTLGIVTKDAAVLFDRGSICTTIIWM